MISWKSIFKIFDMIPSEEDDDAFIEVAPADRTAGSIRGAAWATSSDSMRAPAIPPIARKGRTGVAILDAEVRRRIVEGSAAPWNETTGEARASATAPKRTGFDESIAEDVLRV